jgi:DNA-binding transcriptional LysR family regulator
MKHVAPLLPAFIQRYPSLRVQLVTANRYHDLIDNHIDIAVRTGEVEPDSETIRRLADTRRVLVAAPRYLDRHGRPSTVQALGQHALLVCSHANNPQELRFMRGQRTELLQVRGLLDANDPYLLRLGSRGSASWHCRSTSSTTTSSPADRCRC